MRRLGGCRVPERREEDCLSRIGVIAEQNETEIMRAQECSRVYIIFGWIWEQHT